MLAFLDLNVPLCIHKEITEITWVALIVPTSIFCIQSTVFPSVCMLAELTCMLQRLLQAPLSLSELLQHLQTLLHRVPVAHTHHQQNTHSNTHHESPQRTHVHSEQLLNAGKSDECVNVCIRSKVKASGEAQVSILTMCWCSGLSELSTNW